MLWSESPRPTSWSSLRSPWLRTWLKQRPQVVTILLVLCIRATSSVSPPLLESLLGGPCHPMIPRPMLRSDLSLAAPACTKLKGRCAEDVSGIPVATACRQTLRLFWGREPTVLQVLSRDTCPGTPCAQITPEWVSREFVLFGPAGPALNTFAVLFPPALSPSGEPSLALTVSQRL